MRTRPLLTLARVESALLLREPAAVGFTLGLPVLLLVLNGSRGNSPDPELGGAGPVDVMVPGFLVYVIATSALMGLPEILADYRDHGILRRLRVSPLRPWHIIGAHALTHLAMSVVGMVLLVGVGLVALRLTPPAAVAATALALAAAAAAMIAIGFVLGSLLPTVRTTQAVAAALYFPAIFLSGAMWPREALPALARRLGDALPTTHAVTAIRSAWSSGTTDWTAIGVLAAVSVGATAVALRTFRWE